MVRIMKFALIAGLLGTVASSLIAQEFRPRQVVPAFDAIVDAKNVGVDESGTWVKDNELVLGVVIGDQARAYPINMLTNPTREIINDKLGGRSIAATW